MQLYKTVKICYSLYIGRKVRNKKLKGFDLMTNTRKMKKAIIAAAAAIAAADYAAAAAAICDFAAALDKPAYYTEYGLVTLDMLPDAPPIDGLKKSPADTIAAAAAAVVVYLAKNLKFPEDEDITGAAIKAHADLTAFSLGYGIKPDNTLAAAKIAAAAAEWIAENKED